MIQLANLIGTDDMKGITEEVKLIVSMMKPDFDFNHFEKACQDVIRLFNGKHPGHQGCNTPYHDLHHTLLVLLAMVRMMHGFSIAENVEFSDEDINIGLISALMHDTGYHQSIDDVERTGAKYTTMHVQRSFEFVNRYYDDNSEFANLLVSIRNVINCTDLGANIEEIRFTYDIERDMGYLLGVADLVGQMADRYYLEKLLFLFDEFHKADITFFCDELDLLQKTFDFFETMKKRIALKFEGFDRFLLFHFKLRWDIEENLYNITIRRNMDYLEKILENTANSYRSYLRRGRYVERYENIQNNGVSFNNNQITLNCTGD